ncbi:hypothetical protein Plhal304r1_c020g0070341 [Plasmopara halstedii]
MVASCYGVATRLCDYTNCVIHTNVRSHNLERTRFCSVWSMADAIAIPTTLTQSRKCSPSFPPRTQTLTMSGLGRGKSSVIDGGVVYANYADIFI